jgi:hypothetical protein
LATIICKTLQLQVRLERLLATPSDDALRVLIAELQGEYILSLGEGHAVPALVPPSFEHGGELAALPPSLTSPSMCAALPALERQRLAACVTANPTWPSDVVMLLQSRECSVGIDRRFTLLRSSPIAVFYTSAAHLIVDAVASAVAAGGIEHPASPAALSALRAALACAASDSSSFWTSDFMTHRRKVWFGDADVMNLYSIASASVALTLQSVGIDASDSTDVLFVSFVVEQRQELETANAETQRITAKSRLAEQHDGYIYCDVQFFSTVLLFAAKLQMALCVVTNSDEHERVSKMLDMQEWRDAIDARCQMFFSGKPEFTAAVAPRFRDNWRRVVKKFVAVLIGVQLQQVNNEQMRKLNRVLKSDSNATIRATVSGKKK